MSCPALPPCQTRDMGVSCRCSRSHHASKRAARQYIYIYIWGVFVWWAGNLLLGVRAGVDVGCGTVRRRPGGPLVSCHGERVSSCRGQHASSGHTTSTHLPGRCRLWRRRFTSSWRPWQASCHVPSWRQRLSSPCQAVWEDRVETRRQVRVGWRCWQCQCRPLLLCAGHEAMGPPLGPRSSGWHRTFFCALAAFWASLSAAPAAILSPAFPLRLAMPAFPPPAP